jgi:hypothetical protein
MKNELMATVVSLAMSSGLAGCAAGTPSVATDSKVDGVRSVSVSVGPCFGFCPVYDLAMDADGTVRFHGVRHTAVSGERSRRAGPDAFRSLATDLARFRPADGTEGRVECDAAVSDTSSYTIGWSGPDGRRAVATLQSGCPAGPGKALEAILRDLPGRLGVGDWAAQTTRPGESRG